MHGYYSTCVFMHNFYIHWCECFFWSKYAYLNTFSILHYFALTDASALSMHIGGVEINILVFVGSVGFVRERGVVSEEIIKIYKRMNILLNRCVK